MPGRYGADTFPVGKARALSSRLTIELAASNAPEEERSVGALLRTPATGDRDTSQCTAARRSPDGAGRWPGCAARAQFGVLLLQIGFIIFYVGAFHAPTPHRIPLAVVAPAAESGAIATKLNLIPSAPLRATAASSPAAARRLLRDDAVSAALVINPPVSATRCSSPPPGAILWPARLSRSSRRPRPGSTAR
jgi:hypothetical protein